MKKLNAVLLIALIASMLAACSTSNNGAKATDTPQASPTTSTVPSNNDAGNENANQAADDLSEKLDLHIMMPAWGGLSWKDDNPSLKQIQEKLNINLKIDWITANQYSDKFSTLVASNNLPDAYVILQPDFLKYQSKEIFLDVKPLLDQYPDLSKYSTEEYLKIGNPSGKYYGLTWYVEPTRASLTVRKDWLEKLHLEVPKTIDEYYEVAKAFTLQDPDGNNKNDTIGLSFSIDPATVNFQHFMFYTGAFGIANQWKEQNGELIPMQVQAEEWKAFLAWMHKGYAEGVIDKDFVTNKGNTMDQLFNAGKLGIKDADYYQMKNDIDRVLLAPPIGPNGNQAVETYSTADRKVVINAKIDAQKQQRLLKLMDYLFSDEGHDLVSIGVEGVDYKKNADGTYEKLTQFDTDRPDIVGDWFIRRDGFYPKKTDDPKRVESTKEAYDLNAKYAWPNAADGMVSETFNKVGADINTKFTQTVEQIIIGSKPIDAIDDAIATWKKNGGDTIIEEMNTAYQKAK